MNSWQGGAELFVLELFPSMRIDRILGEGRGVDLFFQAGMGLSFVGSSGGNYFTGDCIGCSSSGGGSDSIMDAATFGFNVGLGIRTRRGGWVDFEFVPKFHMSFPGDDTNSFVSFDISVILGTPGG
ncbi:MAG: hypothetical protein PHQ19_09675 [Candidatus Krumholzibacteria bacterium]|nr:hypothetical protein [Candidatus Krumholzibacteria bacterium]